ncbi:hypothetical protein [Rubripirellula tenax]|uniref:hypothetical protein n=1 Tax=Rubripirellula tenax TaxID=2528015 RepID=UPI0016445738|nr:hypothetical protein [Rubripirellula tenax]
MSADPVQIALSPDGSRVVAVAPTVAGDNLVVWDSRSGSIGDVPFVVETLDGLSGENVGIWV